MTYTNSSLVTYTNLTTNHSGLRGHSIDRITPHCIVGQWTAKKGCDFFATERHDASCNYICGIDGVGLSVEEKNRSWCSSSPANDSRAVTIECASDLSEPYAFRPEVYNRLIDLCVDICKRNGKTKLLWLGTLAMTEAYTPKPDEMVLSVHRWYQPDKSCPGNWLMSRMDELAAKVTMKLAGDDPEPQPEPEPDPEPISYEPFSIEGIPVLKNGDVGDTVKAAQGELIAYGHPCGGKKDWQGAEHPDGIFGNVTQSSVQAFQREHNLPDSGVIDQRTRKVLLGL